MRRLALAVLVWMAGERAAEACSPPYCRPARVPVGDAPANIAALPVYSSGERFSDPGNAADVSLWRDGYPINAMVVADTTDPGGYGFLLVPAEQLEVGSYVLQVLERCPNGGPGTPAETREYPFAITAGATEPSTLGTVTVQRTGVEPLDVATGSGSCNVPIQAAIAEVTITPSPEVAAFAKVARYTLLVDGQVWAISDYGSLGTTSDFAQLPHTVSKVFARCDTPDGGGALDDRGVAPGVHLGEVRVHLAGATSDLPPVAFMVDVSCQERPITLDGGVFDASSGADAFVVTPDASGTEKVQDGCQVSGRGGSPWIVLGLLVPALARRKHRRPVAR